eukprot:764228_1
MESAKAFFMPSHGHIKHKVLQGRHTDMTSVDIIHELRDRLIECYGSIQAAINDTFDLSWDEITIDDGMHINVSNFAADGRPSYLQSDNTLECVRHVLFNVNYDKVDDMAGSKYILQLVIRGTTSSFVWYGPHFGSLSGLSAMNILGHVEDDFLLAAKLCLDFEISAIHFDLCGHHQQYFLYRTEKRTLKALIGRPILIDIEFYTRNRQVVLVPDKDHSIKALRNYIYNHPNKWTDWYSLKRARELDLQSTDPVLELETTTLYLDRFNKMNMKYIYNLFCKKNILSFRLLDAKHSIPKLAKTLDFVEKIYDCFMGHCLNLKLKPDNFTIDSLSHNWFDSFKKAYESLCGFIDNYACDMADITRLSLSGLYHGLVYIAKQILSSDGDAFYCPAKSGEAIVEKLFSKIRG